jgi:predicted dehydrogenase
MKNGKLQVAVIGCGGIANQKHLPALKSRFRYLIRQILLHYSIIVYAKKKKLISHYLT